MINNASIFHAMKLGEVTPQKKFKNAYPSARQYHSKSTGLNVAIANEAATSGYHMCVWHPKRWPTHLEMQMLKEVFVPDDVTIAIPLGTPAEMHVQPLYMLWANEIHAVNHEPKQN